jgi:hypothetical protein
MFEDKNSKSLKFNFVIKKITITVTENLSNLFSYFSILTFYYQHAAFKVC